MAVKYGSGPRPAAHSAKRRFLNCLAWKLVSHLPALPVKLRGPKHYGSEVRIRARGRQPIVHSAKRRFPELPRN